MKKEKQVFKVGDRVYHISYGWGVVKSVGYGSFPISVSFVVEGYDDYIVSFSNDGFETSADKAPLLSFTEYTLQGFSQERPIQLPKRNELCLVSNSQNFEDLKLGFFKEYKDGFFKVEHHSLIGTSWRYLKRIKILD